MDASEVGVAASIMIQGRSDAVMLRDDKTGGGGQRPGRNVLGEPIEICSFKPMTGFYRDGCCNTGQRSHGVRGNDLGISVFFEIAGNDLSTPVPEFGFPGLK
jgi:uncharacterized protein (DUF2237 family)